MVGAVILAAGLSSRMGSCKLTLKLRNMYVIEHVIEHVLDSDIERENIVLVANTNEKAISEIGRRYGVLIVENENTYYGLSTSVKLGLKAMKKKKCEHIMFILGDQPFIYPEDINSMIKSANQNKNKIIVPQDKTGEGNPIIFPQKYYEAINAIKGDIGARQIVKANKDSVVYVKMKKSCIHFDIDTQEDYIQAQRMAKENRD